MLRESKIKIKLAVAISFLFTPLWLLIVYMNWNLLGHDISMAIADFDKWPWFKGSCVLSTFTFLFPFFAHWVSEGKPKELYAGIAVYGVGLIWFPLIFMYPGTEALGINSDSKGFFAFFPISLIHYLCARQIAKEIICIDTERNDSII